MHPANRNPLIQVLIWDRTPNKEGRALMDNLRYSAFQTIKHHTLITESSLGLLEVKLGGWNNPHRPGVTRFFVVLMERSEDNMASIDMSLPGNLKHFI